MTAKGLRNINKYTATVTKGLFGDPHAISCNLLFSRDNLNSSPTAPESTCNEELSGAGEIVREVRGLCGAE